MDLQKPEESNLLRIMRTLGLLLLLAAVFCCGTEAFRIPFLSAHGDPTHEGNHTGDVLGGVWLLP